MTRSACGNAGEPKVARLRCAIYTRKSTEDGLNQPFNTLEAQREAAESYILSQRHVGWSVITDHYDDGGYTGGTLERPALQKLVADMEAGCIDCVVVYKVDRLSRSLLDFARLMDVFERHSISLVSVTQPLNTTVSLGRLTLNILLSFAQFEREIISERTRDKMAAARKKGKWMGGIPVLGYDAPGGGKLVVNSKEAEHVRAIFAWFLEFESVEKVLSSMQEQGWTNKRRGASQEMADAGRPFTRNGLERLLSNVVYIGQVRHEGKTYSGEQPGIVEESNWCRAQKLLAVQRVRRLARNQATNLTSATPRRTVEPNGPQERIPRIARLMALAVKFERMIRDAVIKDYAVLAASGHVSRARVTQIMNLLNLAPDIQEQILFLKWEEADQCGIHEQSLRRLTTVLRWKEQRARWDTIRSRSPRH